MGAATTDVAPRLDRGVNSITATARDTVIGMDRPVKPGDDVCRAGPA
jgi:hypothetical protein